jgi:mannose-6-phosphate isomerase-like protein (cupin superfamily)
MRLILSAVATLILLANSSAYAKDKATQLYLSEVKMPPQSRNIHVHKLFSDANASNFIVFIRTNVPPHKHLTHTETVYVLEGTAVLMMDGEKIEIGPGHYSSIPQGTVHSVTVTSDTPLKVLSIQAPQFLGKDRVKVP